MNPRPGPFIDLADHAERRRRTVWTNDAIKLRATNTATGTVIEGGHDYVLAQVTDWTAWGAPDVRIERVA